MENTAAAENEIELMEPAEEDLDSEELLLSDEDASAEELELIESEELSLEEVTGDVSAFLDDPVKLYLKEIGMYPLLTPEEEIAVSKRIDLGRASEVLTGCISEDNSVTASLLQDNGYEHQDFSILIGKNAKDLQDFIADGKMAEEKMLNSNLLLVVSIARRYTGRGLLILDLIQEGNLGLMKALDKFDYRKGFKFSTYATWWIKQGITRAIADQARTIRVPVHMVETMNRFVRTSRKLLVELGREPEPEEIAAAMDVPVSKVFEMIKLGQDTISLDTPLGEEEDTTLGEMVSDDKVEDPSDAASHTILRKEIDAALEHLTEREEKVIRMRFGLDNGGSAMTLEEIGAEFGVTRERIRQIEAKAIRKLQRKSSRIRLEDWMSN